MIVGRVFGLIMIAASIGWLPILQAMQGAQLWNYLQSISSTVTPAWVVVFVLGAFWKRCTEQVIWSSHIHSLTVTMYLYKDEGVTIFSWDAICLAIQ